MMAGSAEGGGSWSSLTTEAQIGVADKPGLLVV
jgi:hypothetical protein